VMVVIVLSVVTAGPIVIVMSIVIVSIILGMSPALRVYQLALLQDIYLRSNNYRLVY
jgi:hypothetical protein